jgi:hypothetical protein
MRTYWSMHHRLAQASSLGCRPTHPLRLYSWQTNRDNDAFGDACDLCINIRTTANTDGDGDGWGDQCDLCPLVADPEQVGE